MGLSGSRRVLAATALVAAWFVAGVFLSPLLPRNYGDALRRLYAPVCHQQPERSFHLAGLPVAVCARCTGAYTGGAVGLLLACAGLRRLRRRRLVWLAAASLPSLIDVGARFVGFPGVGDLARAALALPAGVVAGLLLSDGIEDLVRMLRERADARTARRISERTCRPAWNAATAGEWKR